MKSLFFTEEHDLFRKSIKEFFAAEVHPHVDKWEKDSKVDRSVLKKMGEMGYFGLNVPEKYGGVDLDFMYFTTFYEEIGRTGAFGFGTVVVSHVVLAMNYIMKAGSEELKQKYLVPSVQGTKIGALALTEPFAGSDLKGMKTTAVREGDHYIVNGSKTFISNGHYGDYIVTALKTETGISLLVIDRESEGLTTSKLDKVGIRSSDTAEIAFDNVKIPVSHLLGQKGKGFGYMMESLQVERLAGAMTAIGGMEYALDLTLNYIAEREAFGRPINKFQVLRHKVAEMASDIAAWKIFLYHTSYRLGQGEFVVKECSMLKLKTADLLNSVVYDCLQMFGGYGFMEEYPIGRLYRDVRIMPIYGGTSEIMKEIISKIVIDDVKYQTSYDK